MLNYELKNRPDIYFGQGKLNELSTIISTYNNILLVYGKSSIKKNGLYDKVISLLKDKNIVEFGGIKPNPPNSQLNEAVSICKEKNIDLILAVGGGSVIDGAKAISIASKSNNSCWDIFINKEDIKEKTDLVTIITNVATGSETNDISVILNDDIDLKRSYKHHSMYPKAAILDPEVTMSVNKYYTTYGLIDTFSHLLEQLINDKNEVVVNNLIISLLKDLMVISPQLLADLENVELRENHMFISMYGYNGEFRAYLTGDWACHGLDYGIASLWDNTHGAGLSVVTPNYIEYLENNEIINNVGKQLFNTSTNKEFALALREYFNSLGAVATFKDMDINPSDDQLKEMASKAMFLSPLGGVGKLNEEDVYNIYKKCL
ncbi:MAG: iron-containing alcohol dehydrogenase [Mycoplasmatales bacterium]